MITAFFNHLPAGFSTEDRSRMALLVRSAAEAFQSEDADPGALRHATMPEPPENIGIILNFTM